MANEELELELEQKAQDTKELLEALTKPAEPDTVNSPEHYNS